MISIFKFSFFSAIFFHLISCQGQPDKAIDYLSEDFDKEAPVFYKMPEALTSEDTSPAWNENGVQILITGTVFEIDGKTPAPNVVIYYYQTNADGRYATKDSEVRNMPRNKLGQTHGYIRGWMKTDANGNYSLKTLRPGSYPNREEPAHIHFTVVEPGIEKPYYIDSVVFDDDPLLTSALRKKMEYRGGSGVIRFVKKEGLLIGERNIILGLNMPDYPKSPTAGVNSGKNIGEDIISFTPFHAYGPDKGTKTCPICKYGWYHGILYFVGNDPNWEEIKTWLTFLETESFKREKYLKVYFIYGNENNFDKSTRTTALENLGRELHLEKVALTFVPSFSDKPSEIYLAEIDPKTRNTFLIYKRSKVIDRFFNLAPTSENFNQITDALDRSVNKYFDLPKPSKN